MAPCEVDLSLNRSANRADGRLRRPWLIQTDAAIRAEIRLRPQARHRHSHCDLPEPHGALGAFDPLKRKNRSAEREEPQYADERVIEARTDGRRYDHPPANADRQAPAHARLDVGTDGFVHGVRSYRRNVARSEDPSAHMRRTSLRRKTPSGNLGFRHGRGEVPSAFRASGATVASPATLGSRTLPSCQRIRWYENRTVPDGHPQVDRSGRSLLIFARVRDAPRDCIRAPGCQSAGRPPSGRGDPLGRGAPISQIRPVKGWIVRSTFLPILLLAISRSYWVCRFSQSCALVPKYRANRRAISAVIARRRRTISLTVGAATPVPSPPCTRSASRAA